VDGLPGAVHVTKVYRTCPVRRPGKRPIYWAMQWWAMQWLPSDVWHALRPAASRVPARFGWNARVARTTMPAKEKR